MSVGAEVVSAITEIGDGVPHAGNKDADCGCGVEISEDLDNSTITVGIEQEYLPLLGEPTSILRCPFVKKTNDDTGRRTRCCLRLQFSCCLV